jgi:hypothetical protein
MADGRVIQNTSHGVSATVRGRWSEVCRSWQLANNGGAYTGYIADRVRLVRQNKIFDDPQNRMHVQLNSWKRLSFSDACALIHTIAY